MVDGFMLSFGLVLFCLLYSGLKAIEILDAYEGTLEDDYPPDNERYEHGEMLLYKVFDFSCKYSFIM